MAYKDKEKQKIKDKEYREKNKDKIKQYYEDNKDELKKYKKQWYEANKVKIKERIKQYKKQKLQNDPLFKLTADIRKLIGIGFKNKNSKKNTKTETILGCSFEEFKKHIEAQFEPWMNWDNKGRYNPSGPRTWQIDHKIPVSFAKTEEEIIRLNHYTNLRPYCSYKNISEGNKR